MVLVALEGSMRANKLQDQQRMRLRRLARRAQIMIKGGETMRETCHVLGTDPKTIWRGMKLLEGVCDKS